MSKNRNLKRGLPVGQSFIALPSDIAQATKLNDEPATKKLRQTLANDADEVTVQVPTSAPTLARSAQTKGIRHIASRIPNIPRIVSSDDVNPSPRSVSPDGVTSSIKLRNTSVAAGRTAPQRYLMSLIQSHAPAIDTVPALSIKNYFLEYTEEHYESYGADAIAAIRAQDIDALRKLHQSGRTLQSTNRFGESLLHMACRRGFTNVVRFLLTEAGVSLKVCDDMGRTAMHDACWTCEPNIELMDLLLSHCPELLVMTDKRGSAPFEYIRGEHSITWMKFLSLRKDLIRNENNIALMKSVQL
eukprot:CAMPEP_0178546162 /NCGR_PEP_ID=MMETSP0697-20121206/4013_1 /TAXON_ID=265572 /ORGANISM="Extubocellulus spinifer, Strain CCMP396" /LENGTH=300 /DNA_ID=CAMNT_0020178747 /DNA_START=87 /DNA_END=989 /DNA_ORIENTATION=+